MTNIFISHANVDNQYANDLSIRIKDIFNLEDERVFNSSEDSIPPGDDWFQSILNALEKSEIVIVILTPQSIKRFWVNFEIGATWGISLGDVKTKLIPCMLGMNLEPLERPLRDLQSINLQDQNNLESLFKNIRTKLKIQGVRDDQIQSYCTPMTYGTEPSDDTIGDIDEPSNYLSNDESIALIKESIAIPDETFAQPHRRYLRRYELGKKLGRLSGFDKEMLEFTETEPLEVNGNRFRAMKYMVTRKLFYQTLEQPLGNSEQVYNPYCLPLETRGGEQIPVWCKQHIKGFIDNISQELGKTCRLPTYEEWLVMARRNDNWRESKRRSNIQLYPTDKRAVCAVGMFPDSASDVGCHDVIGNAWELCLDHQQNPSPTYVVGWSYENPRQPQEGWWSTQIDVERIQNSWAISFRLITTEV